MMAFITIRIKGTEGYTRSALSKDRMVLGRASAADIPIKHTSISREHCAFVRDGARWLIEDLGSSNGTWLGREKVSGKLPLEERAIVKIGQARLTFHDGDLSQAHAEGDAAIEISGEEDDGSPADAVSAEQRHRSANDPSEAITCSACGAWFSIAHRLSGESMACPRCGHGMTVPVLV